MSADRERLAEALRDKRQYWDPEELRDILDDLLPVVQALVAEGAAAELRAAAAAWTDFRLASDQLRARADALTAGSQAGT